EVAFGLENLCLPEAEIEERVNHWLARFELEAVRDQANNTLSGGQKQRLMLASILAMGPRLLLLDEPLAQLDAAGVAELLDELDRLRATGLIVVVAEHRLDELLRRADRLLILAGGRIISDSSSKGAEATAALVQADLAPPTPQPVFIARSTAPSSAEFIVRINGLTFRWPGKAEALWSDVRFDIHPGECVALVGPNGSGKTTLLSALAGLLRPAAGQVEWSEAPRGSSSIGLTPQNPDLALFCRTVGEELAFGPQQLNLPASEIEQRVSQAAEALSIDDLLDQAPLALSQGQRLRVAVAAALTLHPRLLLLDEPSTGQDPRHVGRLLTAVRGYVASGDVGAVLFSTHDPRLVERYATRVLAVAEGKLLADCAPVVLFANEGLLSRAGLRATSRRLQSTTAPVARLARPPR
ncbi:MAG TPA: ABC transporter ATP-binding protein, partial [Pirellulales bacterium]